MLRWNWSIIPVILGTTRQGRMSEHVARFVFGEIGKREGVESELIDIRELDFPMGDAGSGITQVWLDQIGGRHRRQHLVPVVRH